MIAARILPLLLLLPASCDGEPAEARETGSPLDRAGRHLRQAGEDLARWLELGREEFEQRAAEEIANLETRLEAARRRVAELSGDAREKAEEKLADLEQRREQVAERLDEAGAAASETWDDAKAAIARSLQSIADELDEVEEGR